MRVVHAAMLAMLLVPALGEAQQPAPATPAPPSAARASSSRTFTAPMGLIFNEVRPERVEDFEKVIGALRQALSTSASATVRAQAQGWRVMKALEQGPNGSAVYVFVLDPAVVGADYGLGRILAEAFPDPTRLQEIWKLYTDSVASGGSLLNLTPVEGTAPEPTPAVASPEAQPAK